MCDLNLRTPPTIHCLISCHFPFCSLQSIQTHVLEVPQTHSRFSSFNFHGLTFGKLQGGDSHPSLCAQRHFIKKPFPLLRVQFWDKQPLFIDCFNFPYSNFTLRCMFIIDYIVLKMKKQEEQEQGLFFSFFFFFCTASFKNTMLSK